MWGRGGGGGGGRRWWWWRRRRDGLIWVRSGERRRTRLCGVVGRNLRQRLLILYLPVRLRLLRKWPRAGTETGGKRRRRRWRWRWWRWRWRNVVVNRRFWQITLIWMWRA